MKDYLEKYLKRELNIGNYDSDRLPLMYSGLYELSIVSVENFEWIAAKPKQKIKLIELKKHIRQLEKYTERDCAFVFNEVSPYIRGALLEAGIPFILIGKEIYLPFSGMMLTTKRNKALKPVHEISFLTQKIILTAIYEKWDAVNVTGIAQRMDVTKTSVTRSMDEIEYCGLPIIGYHGSRRVITISEDAIVLWNAIKPYLRNPVIKKFDCGCDYGLEFKSGISALAEYTMLADNSYRTYGVLKKDIKPLNIHDDYKQLLVSEKSCEILELGYMIEFHGKRVMDPLSLVLSLSEEDMADERVAIAVDEMLEEYVW